MCLVVCFYLKRLLCLFITNWPDNLEALSILLFFCFLHVNFPSNNFTPTLPYIYMYLNHSHTYLFFIQPLIHPPIPYLTTHTSILSSSPFSTIHTPIVSSSPFSTIHPFFIPLLNNHLSFLITHTPAHSD